MMGRGELSKSPYLGGSILYKSIGSGKVRETIPDGGEEELIPEAVKIFHERLKDRDTNSLIDRYERAGYNEKIAIRFILSERGYLPIERGNSIFVIRKDEFNLTIIQDGEIRTLFSLPEEKLTEEYIRAMELFRYTEEEIRETYEWAKKNGKRALIRACAQMLGLKGD